MIHVLVCTGTTCHSLGSTEILGALQKFPEPEKDLIDLSIHQCCSRCQLDGGLCPSVRINDDWIVPATPKRVKEKLRELLDPILKSQSESSSPTDPFAKYFGDT